MLYRPAEFLEPLSRFVLEVLPWGLSGLIVLYLIWGVWSAPEGTPADVRPVAAQSSGPVSQAL
jgi:hypothetical protein